jgi:hypothetical protein
MTEDEGPQMHYAEVRTPHSSRLVSALTDLVLHT